MPYVVIRRGQLREHQSFDNAKAEAERLINRTGDEFYIAELLELGSVTKTSWTSLKKERLRIEAEEYNPWAEKQEANIRAGKRLNEGCPWTEAADQELLRMWKTGAYSMNALAIQFGRTKGAISSRLHCRFGITTYPVKKFIDDWR